MSRRLQARIKSLTETVRNRRGLLLSANNYGGRQVMAGYIQAGAQRDLAKLHLHSRAAHLAYAFLRYRPYRMVERVGSSEPPWGKVKALIEQYGEDEPGVLLQRFAEWRDSDEAEISEHGRAALHARWVARRERVTDLKSMVDRADALRDDAEASS